MKINRNNCEAFFLDYHEGKLTPLQVAELMQFLEKNSDLKIVFEEFENITLDEEGIVFEEKNELKRLASVSGRPSFDELCIADVEGEILPEEKKTLNKLISENASLYKEYQLYKKTKLVPEAIIFENKLLLKKQFAKPAYRTGRSYIVNRTYYVVAAAASVILILGLFFLFRNDSAENKPGIANNTKKEAPSVSPLKKVFPETNNKNEMVTVAEEVKNNSAAKNKVKKRVFPETNNKNEEKKDVIYMQEEFPLVKKEEKKELPPLPELKKEETPVVVAENKQRTTNNEQLSTNSEEYLTLKEAVASKIKTNLLADELPEQELKGDNAKKLRGWDIVALAAKGVRKLTGKDVNVGRKYDSKDNIVASSLNIGNFGVERTLASK